MPFKEPSIREYKFDKHKREFIELGMIFNTDADYEAAADDFMSGAVPVGARHCQRPNGEQVRFHRSKRILGIKAPSGVLMTFYRPSDKSIGWGYFEFECKVNLE